MLVPAYLYNSTRLRTTGETDKYAGGDGAEKRIPDREKCRGNPALTRTVLMTGKSDSDGVEIRFETKIKPVENIPVMPGGRKTASITKYFPDSFNDNRVLCRFLCVSIPFT